jgi:HlyD family secretion protein
VRIALDERDERVLPDMGVKVTFITSDPATAATTAVVIPRAAQRRDGEHDVVFVVQDRKAERRAVRVATTQGDQVRLVSGVTAGEQVIIAGPPELRDGDAVRVSVRR